MKKIITSFVLLLTLLVSSCSQFDDSAIWDKLENHEKRIAALEELCKQMNTNISSLRSLIEALEKHDYITNISPINKDGEVIGYTISFAYSDTITIYHGENGKNGSDGADGADGYTPQIGVMEDTDGIYYWTLDGEWLLDDNGNKIKAVGTDGADGTNGTNGEDGVDGVDGINGEDGKDGVNGKDGEDGITPRLKIENDHWFVSYDNGTTWLELGKATGNDGENGVDGESLIKSITIGDNSVTFILTNEQIITIPLGDNRENNKIYYTTTDGKKFIPYNTDPYNWGAILISSTYENGQGVMVFDDDISHIYEMNCSRLVTITIPNSVTSIGNWAFSGCESLTSITIPSGVTDIEDGTFYNCSSLESVTIPDSVTHIGYDAFSGCSSLKSIDIPDSVTWIGNSAFSGCSSLESATIPDSVTHIGASAFSGCTGELIIDNKIIETDYTDTYYLYGEFESSNWLYGSNFSSIIIGENVTKIGNLALYRYSSLTNITIPNNVISIGAWAFSGCSNLVNVTIGNGITKIETGVFSGCSNLANITIPDNVASIEASAFNGCSSLENITIPDSVTYIGAGAFRYCSSLTSLTIGNGITSFGQFALHGCSSLAKINSTFASEDERCLIIDGVLYAFAPAGLTEYAIPNSANFILHYAFWGCQNLKSVTIPDSVTYIGGYAFYECSGLANLYCKSTTPPKCYDDSSLAYGGSDLKIYVPTESIDKYQTADVWQYYASSIIGYDF